MKYFSLKYFFAPYKVDEKLGREFKRLDCEVSRRRLTPCRSEEKIFLFLISKRGSRKPFNSQESGDNAAGVASKKFIEEEEEEEQEQEQEQEEEEEEEEEEEDV